MDYTAARHDRHRSEGPGLAEGNCLAVAGERYRVEVIPQMKLEVVVDDKDAETVIDLICDTLQTGEAGDGKIFVYPVEDVVWVRTKGGGCGAV